MEEDEVEEMRIIIMKNNINIAYHVDLNYAN